MKCVISKSRFMNYLKVQQSGVRNMFGYDMGIQENYDGCYTHFVTKNEETDFVGEGE